MPRAPPASRRCAAFHDGDGRVIAGAARLICRRRAQGALPWNQYQHELPWLDFPRGLPGAAQEHNSAFIGAFALAGITDQAKLDSYVNAWLADKQGDDKPYFQGTLRVLYLMTAAGRFSSGL